MLLQPWYSMNIKISICAIPVQKNSWIGHKRKIKVKRIVHKIIIGSILIMIAVIAFKALYLLQLFGSYMPMYEIKTICLVLSLSCFSFLKLFIKTQLFEKYKVQHRSVVFCTFLKGADLFFTSANKSKNIVN